MSRDEFITLKKASELLKKGINRLIKPRFVEMYCADMLTGKWRGETSPILLRKDGSVADGQHRLLAVIKAANENKDFKGVLMTFIDNVTDKDVYQYSIKINPQSPDDRIFRRTGISIDHKLRKTATFLARLVAEERTREGLDIATGAVWNLYAEEIKSIINEYQGKSKLCSFAIYAGFTYALITRPDDDHKIVKMVEDFIEGVNLPRGARNYRDRLVSGKEQPGMNSGGVTLAIANIVNKVLDGKGSRIMRLGNSANLPGFSDLRDEIREEIDKIREEF